MSGLKANLGRLETRLNCVELAKEQDTGEGGFIYYTERHMDLDESRRKRHIGKGRNYMRGYRPMTEEEIGERRNGMEDGCCRVEGTQLQNLKRKAYKI